MGRPLSQDLTGKTFGRLTVIGRINIPNPHRQPQWACQCSCGKAAIVSGNGLRSGKTKSCGCLNDEKRVLNKRTHGKSWTRVWRIWCGMRNRCHNPNQPHYERYGGRGIYVCDEWRESFEAFYAAMGDPPTDQHTIDRIDNDGPYAPGNCKWSTHAEQTLNKRPRRRRR